MQQDAFVSRLCHCLSYFSSMFVFTKLLCVNLMFVFFPSEYNTSEAFCLPKKYHIHTQKLVYIQSGGSVLLQHLMP